MGRRQPDLREQSKLRERPHLSEKTAKKRSAHVIPIERDLILVHGPPDEVLHPDPRCEQHERRAGHPIEPPQRRQAGRPQQERDEHRVLCRRPKHDRDRLPPDGAVALDVLEILGVDRGREDARAAHDRAQRNRVEVARVQP